MLSWLQERLDRLREVAGRCLHSLLHGSLSLNELSSASLSSLASSVARNASDTAQPQAHAHAHAHAHTHALPLHTDVVLVPHIPHRELLLSVLPR